LSTRHLIRKNVIKFIQCQLRNNLQLNQTKLKYSSWSNFKLLCCWISMHCILILQRQCTMNNVR